MRVHLRNNPAKFHPDPFRNNGAFCFFSRRVVSPSPPLPRGVAPRLRSLRCTFCLCCSYTGNDESVIVFGDSQGCVSVLMIQSAGECLRYFEHKTTITVTQLAV